MTVPEVYSVLGADYENVKSRLATDERIAKYLKKFIDTKDYSDLKTAINDGEWEKAFLSVHTLKGMALNLGLTNLASSASNLTEELRGGLKSESAAVNYFSKVTEEYTRSIDAINTLDS